MVRGKIEMQVRDVVAKDINVDLLGISGLAQGAGDAARTAPRVVASGPSSSVMNGMWRRGSRWANPGIGPCVTQESRHKVSCHTRVRRK
jgi:hypothetical protein